MAAKASGPDPDTNPALRLVMDKAKAANMPNDNVDRAIKKATSATEGENYDEVSYEGYGPGGVAILVHALTDNRNRTATNVRVAFTRNGGNLGETGSVSYMFEVTSEQKEQLQRLVDKLEDDDDVSEVYTSLEE